MAEQAKKATQAPEKKQQAERTAQSEGEQLENAPGMAAGLLSLQRAAGNRAVGRLIRGERLPAGSRAGVMRRLTQTGTGGAGSTMSGLVQLFRSGIVPGNIRFEEGPADEITIQIPFQMDSFEQVLEGIQNVVESFGSSRRRYVDSPEFQAGLRGYLQSVRHPSTGGSPMSRQRSVSIRVRIARGEGNRVEQVDFISGEALAAPEVGSPAAEQVAGEAPAVEVTAEETSAGSTPAAEGRGAITAGIPAEQQTAGSGAAPVETPQAAGSTPGPADEVAVIVPYQAGSFEAILDQVEEQIQPYDPDSWMHLQDAGFQEQLRQYLLSIGHPSVMEEVTPGGGEEPLRLQIELVRGAGDTIESIALATPAAAARAGSPSGEQASRPAGTSQAETAQPREERSLWSRFFSGVAEVEETVGDIASARWLYDRLNGYLDNIEREFALIGEDTEHMQTLDRVAMPFLTLVHTILRMAVGLVDTVARLNPINLEMQLLSREARALAGDYGWEEFSADFLALLRFNFSLTIWAPLITAGQHLRQAREERNEYRFWQGLSELILALVAIVSLAKSLRSSGGAGAGAAETRAAPGEAGRLGAPAEPGQLPAHAEPARLSAPAEQGRLAAPSEPPRLPAHAEERAAPAVEAIDVEGATGEMAPSEASRGVGEPPAARPGPEPAVDARREAARQRYEQYGLPGLVRRVFRTAGEARAALESQISLDRNVIALEHPEFVAEWNRLGEGAGEAAAWTDSLNVLRIDRSMVPEAQNLSPMARAVPRPRATGRAAAPAEAVDVEGATGQIAAPEGVQRPVEAPPAGAPVEAVDVEGATGQMAAPESAQRPVEAPPAGAAAEAVDVEGATGEMAVPEEARASQTAAAPRRGRAVPEATEEGVAARPVEVVGNFSRSLGETEARAVVDGYLQNQLPEGCNGVRIPRQRLDYIEEYRRAGGAEEAPPPGWADRDGVVHLDSQRLNLPDRVLDEYTRRQMSPNLPAEQRAAEPLGPEEFGRRGARGPWRIEQVYNDADSASAAVRQNLEAERDVRLVNETSEMDSMWRGLGREDPRPIAFLDSDGLLVVDNEALGRARGVSSEAAALEGAAGPQETPGRARGAAEQAGAEPARAAATAEIQAAARAAGIHRYFLESEIDAARRVLDAVEQGQSPRQGISGLAMQQRWNRMVGMGETPVAMLMENGLFVFNRQALVQP